MNVTRWRDAAPFENDDDGPSALSLELWMNHSASAEDADETRAGDASDVVRQALSLALAWRALWNEGTGARALASAVWVAPGADGRLELLGRDGEFDDEANSETVVVASEAAWPEESFWLLEGEGAPRDLALQLGMLSGAVASPSLCVPLGPEAILLLWLRSDDGELGISWQNVVRACARQSALLLGFAMRLEKMNATLHGLAEVVADAIDEREAHREGRSRAVSYYAALIAREMGLSESEAAAVEFAALWHGLGRLSVPENLLGSDAKMNEEERALVRASSEWGARKLGEVDGLGAIAAIVRHQNERFDGGGTPDALSGEEIPIGARILAVASRFASMTGRRADRGPLSVVGGAMEGVAAASGEALDPHVVAAFLRAMGRSL